MRLKGIRLSERTIWKIIRKGDPIPVTTAVFTVPRLHEATDQVPVGV